MTNPPGTDTVLMAGAVVFLVCILTLFGFWYLGPLGHSSVKTMAVIAAAIAVFYIKMFIQDLVTDPPKLPFYRNGYDLCVMTLSTAMAASATEYFATGQGKKLGMFLAILAAAMVGTLFAARNAKFVRGNTKDGFHGGLTFAFGLGLFVMSLYILVEKS